MADDAGPRARYGEAFWRAHHEAWKRSDLNQREYCEAQGLSLKAFGNWRAKFKAEPQPPARKMLYRRGGASHTLSHATYPSFESSPGPIVPPARAGHRRRFSEADRRHILAEADEPGASISEVARRYGIARRVLCRWRQEQAAASPVFVDVEIVDAPDAEEVGLSNRDGSLVSAHDRFRRRTTRRLSRPTIRLSDKRSSIAGLEVSLRRYDDLPQRQPAPGYANAV
jgi:transposase-like protein